VWPLNLIRCIGGACFCQQRAKRLRLIILAGLALACPARAGQFWDLFRTGHLEEAKALIVNNPKLINTHDSEGQMTPLHLAAHFGTPELVLFFIERGADVNALEYNNFTPLHDATTGEIAKVLIKHGADTTRKDAWGDTALQKAAEDAYLHPNVPGYPGPELCAGMLEAGAKLDIVSALYLGKRDEAMKMVAADPGVLREHEKVCNLWHNVTPLGIAAEEGDKEMVELFLKNSAPVDGPTGTPMSGVMTPLGNALSKHHLEVAEILLKAGASIDSDLIPWVDKQPDAQIKELIHRYLALRAKDKSATGAK
jgi:ankyrin repeat protein